MCPEDQCEGWQGVPGFVSGAVQGTVEDIRAADKAGVVHSVAAETASTAANGAGAIANIAQMTTGMSALGGGMIGATLSVFSGIIAGATAPAPRNLSSGRKMALS